MSVLKSLKLVELTPAAPRSVLNRRRKLIEAIDAQLVLLGCDDHNRRKEDAQKRRPGAKRTRRWWHETWDGKAILTIRYCGRPLEFAHNKAAIECDHLDQVGPTLKMIRHAVAAGELDHLLRPKPRVTQSAAHTANGSGQIYPAIYLSGDINADPDRCVA